MRQYPMQVKMLLFGQLKEAAGFSEQAMEMFEGDSVADLLKALHLSGACPDTLLAVSAVAVNQEYARSSRVLRDGDEVAILPPVSGGRA